jgi:hypothetical protein
VLSDHEYPKLLPAPFLGGGRKRTVRHQSYSFFLFWVLSIRGHLIRLWGSGRGIHVWNSKVAKNRRLTVAVQKFTPFLWFDNQAEEATGFYASNFPNSKIGKIVRCGAAGPGPPGSALKMKKLDIAALQRASEKS